MESDPYGAVSGANISPAPKTDKLVAKYRKRYKFWNIVQLVQMEGEYFNSAHIHVMRMFLYE